MGYNVMDLIDKAIAIAIKKKTLYENIDKDNKNFPPINIMSKVFISRNDKTIIYYKELKNKIGHENLEDIDFQIYDKMSFLINEFNRRTYSAKIHNIKDYLKFSLGLEKDMLSLLLDIKGRFVVGKDDINTTTYRLLSEIIDNKSNQIKMIEDILSKY